MFGMHAASTTARPSGSRAQVTVLADASLPWILRRWVGLAVSGGTTR